MNQLLETIPDGFKSGYVTIIGRPNAGKSTLMNTLLQEKLAITTPKPQTTRHSILGIMNDQNHQIILTDTPGLVSPRYLLQDKMMDAGRRSMRDADLLLVLADPKKDQDKLPEILEIIGQHSAPKVLVWNKSDLLSEETRQAFLQQEPAGFTQVLAVSALKKEGLDALIQTLLGHLPNGFPFYPPDMLSEAPERFFVAELIREQVFMNYGAEIPYAAHVQIQEFTERDRGKDFIRAMITVERASQKAILIGKGGQALKRIGSLSRKEVEDFLQRPVFLQLDVRVRAKWRKNPAYLKEYGYT